MLLLIMYILFRTGIVYTDITIYKCLQKNLSLPMSLGISFYIIISYYTDFPIDKLRTVSRR